MPRRMATVRPAAISPLLRPAAISLLLRPGRHGLCSAKPPACALPEPDLQPFAQTSPSPTADGDAAVVFISYSRRDLAFLNRLEAALQARGVKTLVDRAEIEVGERWFARLQDLISKAETIVFVLSPDSVRSKVCADEVDYGTHLGKRFIPVVARAVEDASVPAALGELNYVFLDDEATYEANVDRLVTAIRTDLGWMRSHAELGRLAEEWNEAGRPRGLLLGGTRLASAETWIAHRPSDAPLPTEDTRDLIARSRKVANQWRNGLFGMTLFGLVVALGLAALAYVQRQEAVAQRLVAERQTALAVQREKETQEQRDVAQSNFNLAKGTIDSVLVDLAQGLRAVDGIRVATLRTVLSRVDSAIGRLSRAAPDDPSIVATRASMLSEFGDTYLAAGDGPSAIAAYQEALDLARALVAQDEDSNVRQRNLVVSLNKVAEFRLRRGDMAAATAAYEEGLAIGRALVRRAPDEPDLKSGLSFSLSSLGGVRLLAGDMAGALAAHEEALAIRRGLVAGAPENAEWRRDVSVSLDMIGDLKVRTGDRAGALAAYEEGLAIARALARSDEGNTLWQRDVSISLTKIGDLKLALGDAAAALSLAEESVRVARGLSRRDPDNTLWLRDIAVGLDQIMSLRQRQGDLAAARAAAAEGLEIRRGLVRRDGANTQWQRDLAVGLNRDGELRQQARDQAGALASYQESVAVIRGLLAKSPENLQLQRDLTVTLNKLASCRVALGDLPAAREAYGEALAISRDLAGRDPRNVEGQTDLVVGLYMTATATTEVPRRHELLDEALAILDRLQAAGLLTADQSGWKGILTKARDAL